MKKGNFEIVSGKAAMSMILQSTKSCSWSQNCFLQLCRNSLHWQALIHGKTNDPIALGWRDPRLQRSEEPLTNVIDLTVHSSFCKQAANSTVALLSCRNVHTDDFSKAVHYFPSPLLTYEIVTEDTSEPHLGEIAKEQSFGIWAHFSLFLCSGLLWAQNISN